MRFWVTIGLCLLAVGTWAAPMGVPNVTGYDRMEAELRADAGRSPYIRLGTLGRSVAGRELRLVRLAAPNVPPSQTVRLLILCRQHGDEPASTEAALALIHRLSEGHDPALAGELSRVTLYLVPMVNPDGAEAHTRANAAGADLNRDWGAFTQPETQAVVRAVGLLRPHVIADAHNWDGGDTYDTDCVEVTRDWVSPVGQAEHALQQDAVAGLARCGYSVQSFGYASDRDPHLAHRYFTQRGTVSFLVETHAGDPRDTADFQRRQGLYLALLHGLTRRYAADPNARLALERLEGDAAQSPEEAHLFPPETAPLPAHVPSSHRSWIWLWAICAYAFALWGAAQGRTRLAGAAPKRFERNRRAGREKRPHPRTARRDRDNKPVQGPLSARRASPPRAAVGRLRLAQSPGRTGQAARNGGFDGHQPRLPRWRSAPQPLHGGRI